MNRDQRHNDLDWCDDHTGYTYLCHRKHEGPDLSGLPDPRPDALPDCSCDDHEVGDEHQLDCDWYSALSSSTALLR